jgi:hypothetical protein
MYHTPCIYYVRIASLWCLLTGACDDTPAVSMLCVSSVFVLSLVCVSVNARGVWRE